MTTAQIPTTKEKASPSASANGHATARPEPQVPALPIDLLGLSDDVLALLASAVPQEQQRRKEKRDAEFLASVAEAASALGLTPARVAAAIRAKATPGASAVSPDDGRHFVKAKYRSKDGLHEWSGRGGKPEWFIAHIQAGGTEHELRIREDTPPEPK